MCTSSPKVPDPAPLPPTVEEPSQSVGEANTGARDSARKKRAAGLSRSDTLLSGGASLGNAPGQKKTLLGG